MTLSRREFLVRTAVAASLAALPRRPAWAASGAADVIVVGAGLSGLNAALTLEEAGLSVLCSKAAIASVARSSLSATCRACRRPAARASAVATDASWTPSIRSRIVLQVQLPQMLKHPDIALVLDGRPIPKAAWKDSPRNPFAGPLWHSPRRLCAGHVSHVRRTQRRGRQGTRPGGRRRSGRRLGHPERPRGGTEGR